MSSKEYQRKYIKRLKMNNESNGLPKYASPSEKKLILAKQPKDKND